MKRLRYSERFQVILAKSALFLMIMKGRAHSFDGKYDLQSEVP